jgi:serine/threonine-protein kinase
MPQNRPWQVAEDLRSGRRVLVTSVVMPEEESRAGGFVEQAAGLVELSTVHDRIARILDYGRDNGRGFIVLEYPQGERLGNLLLREGPLDVRRSLCFGVQIAGVLEAVHLRGAAHGRLAVDDVLVVGDSVKVGGFERTLVEQYASEPCAGRTATCNADESAAAAQRADITALAALLYFMMTDINPSEGSCRLIPLRRIQRNVPVSVERVIMDVLGDRRGKVQSDPCPPVRLSWPAPSGRS